MCKDEKQRIKDIGYEPMDTELVEDDMNKFKDNHGFSLYCDRCKIYRLPRAHHCSTCGQWSAWMDHHCVLINNCLGWANYKYFIRFTLYGSITGSLYLYMNIPFILRYLSDINTCLISGRLYNLNFGEIFLLFYFQVIFLIITLLTIFNVIVFNRISKGQTQLEHSRNSNDLTYDLGFDKNWDMVFGRGRTNYKYPFSFFNKTGWFFLYMFEPARDVETEIKHFYGFELTDDSDV